MLGKGLSRNIGFHQLHLDYGIPIGKAPFRGKLLCLSMLVSREFSLFDQDVEEGLASKLVPHRLKSAAHAFVVVPLALRIGQAEHGLRDLVQEFLRLDGVLPCGVLADVRIQLLVVRTNFRNVIVELPQTQEFVVVWGARPFRDAQPFLVDVHL